MSGDVFTPGYVQVRLSAIRQNYASICSVAGEAEVGAVVKADAYGLGASRIAEVLQREGCRSFFVATLEEGIDLRKTLTSVERAQIYVFEGLREGSAHLFTEHALAPVLNTREQIDAWLHIGGSCAIHLDTGMNRLGVSSQEFASVIAEAATAERLGLRFLMTHLGCADDPSHPQNQQQIEAFHATRQRAGNIRVSIANSAGVFLGERFHGDLVRPGIALYGGNPFSQQDNPMAPVATLNARVLQVRELNHAAGVGYGATFAAAAGTRIATVGVGYADGYPRMLGNLAHAAFEGRRIPVVGRVSMDLTCLDVTELTPGGIAAGDYVELFGETVTVDEIARLCATISYEILTGLNARLPRIYVD